MQEDIDNMQYEFRDDNCESAGREWMYMKNTDINKVKKLAKSLGFIEERRKRLPKLYRRVIELRFGTLSGEEGISIEETANKLDITPDQVRELQADALRMLRQPSKNDRKMVLVPFSCLGDPDEFRYFTDDGAKPVFSNTLFCKRSYAVDEKNPDYVLDIRILVKNRNGIRTLNRIVSSEYIDNVDNNCNHITNTDDNNIYVCDLDYLYAGVCDLDYILSDREGVLLGRSVSWSYIRTLAQSGFSDDEIKESVEFRYGDMDFVELCPYSLMHQINEKVKDKCGISDLKTIKIEPGEDVRLAEIAVMIARYLKSIGKIVIADINTAGVDESYLNEYGYLGDELAMDVMVREPLLLEEQIEYIEPYSADDKRFKLPDADEKLKAVCYERAHEKYGERLPVQVSERMSDELDKIMSHGYSSYYLAAAEITGECRRLSGYTLARGSVGASYVAYITGITGTNPLPPHYFCPACGYVDFSPEKVSGRISSGFDLMGAGMGKRSCPKCGNALDCDGHDIHFEVFAGLNGEKHPHFEVDVTPELRTDILEHLDRFLGNNKVFHASAAFGIEQWQHPFKIIMISPDKEIYDYTSIRQLTTNDGYTDGRATARFSDHRSMFDAMGMYIIGNDRLSFIHQLEKMTSVKANSISIEEIDYRTFFEKELNKDIPPLHLAGKFADTASLNSFSDIVRILGYYHQSPDVWEGDAVELFKKNFHDPDKVIPHRDDVMNTLIRHGIGREDAYRIMMLVRKGRVKKELTENDYEMLRSKGISEEYIESIKTIKYLFPKVHDTEYAIFYSKLIWYRLNYPEEYLMVQSNLASVNR